MSVYAKKLNGKQRAVLLKYERICGFEPMWQEDLDAGNITFRELWHKNVRWLEDVLAEVTNINTNGCFDSDEQN